MEAIREGKWRCKSCSSENRGSHEKCISCAWTRDDTVEFYLPDDAPVVTDEKQIAAALAGPDWICDACSNANAAAKRECDSCGSPKGSKRAKSGEVIPPIAAAGGSSGRIQAAAPAPVWTKGVTGPSSDLMSAPARPMSVDFGAPSTRPPLGCIALVIAAMAITFACISWAFQRHDASAIVTVASWKRTISVEHLLPVHESDWDGAPAGARDVTHRPEMHHTVQVQVGTHTEYTRERYRSGTESYPTTKKVQTGTRTVVTGHRNLGNGHFQDITKSTPVYSDVPTTGTRPVYSYHNVPHEVPTYVDQPVFREKYFYVVDRWSFDREEVAQANNASPTWPNVIFAPNERECGRTERYEVTFSLVGEQGATKSLSGADDNLLRRYPVGSTWHVVWSHAGDIEVLGPVNVPAEAAPVTSLAMTR